jgi:hypothetical protein
MDKFLYLFAIAYFSLLDALLTLTGVIGLEIAVEANPFMAWIMEFGTWEFLVVKILLPVGLVGSLFLMKTPSAYSIAKLACVMYGGISMYNAVLTNVYLEIL